VIRARRRALGRPGHRGDPPAPGKRRSPAPPPPRAARPWRCGPPGRSRQRPARGRSRRRRRPHPV